MNRLSRLFLQSLSGLAIAATMILPASAATPANHLVISQIQTAGTGGLLDEFIELYNPTDKPVAITGWSVQYKAGNVTLDNTLVQPLPEGAVVRAYSYYLLRPIGMTQPNDTNYAGFQLDELAGNVFLVNGVTQVAALTDTTIVDRVGYGAGGDASEGGSATAPTLGQSIERLPGADLGEGNATDTHNNAVDWAVRTTPKPRTSAALAEIPSLPTLTVLAPASNSYVATMDQVINATATDVSGIDASSIQLWINGLVTGTPAFDAATGKITVPVTLAQGTHTAKLSVADMIGYTTTHVWAFTVDSIAPIASLELNDGGPTTVSRSVLIKPIINEGPAGVASGLKEMQISFDGVFDTEVWEAYQTSFTRQLPDGSGAKTVTIRVRDRADNLSNSASANIFYEQEVVAAPTEAVSVTSTQVDGHQVVISWQKVSSAVAYYVRYTDGTTLYGPFLTHDTTYTVSGLDSSKNYRFEVASVTAAGTVSDFVKVGPKTQVIKTTAVVEFPTGGPVEQPSPSYSAAAAPTSPEPTLSPSPSPTPEVEGASDDQSRDWTRIIVALSLLIIAAGLATGGWYLYQWWTSRPTDKGKGGRW